MPTTCHPSKRRCVILNSKYAYYSKNTLVAIAGRFSAGGLVGLKIFLNTLSFIIIPPLAQPRMDPQD